MGVRRSEEDGSKTPPLKLSEECYFGWQGELSEAMHHRMQPFERICHLVDAHFFGRPRTNSKRRLAICEKRRKLEATPAR